MSVDLKQAVALVQKFFRDFQHNTAGNGYDLEEAITSFERAYGICGKTDGQLLILDYDSLQVKWTEPYGHVCRGLILDANNFDVVAFGLPKFFNLGEFYADAIDFSTARVVEKLDGSCVQRFWNPYTDRFEFSTRFQLPRDLAKNECKFGLTWQEVIERALSSTPGLFQPPECTFVYEIMSPANKIVVQHQDFKARLIAMRRIDRGFEFLQELSLADHPYGAPSFPLSSMDEVVAAAEKLKGVEQEGFVVVDAQFRRVKVKGTQYVQLHRLKDENDSPRALINLARGRDYDEVLVHFPEMREPVEQALDVIDRMIARHAEVYDSLKDIETQKEFALKLQNIEPKLEMQGLLFMLRAGKISSIEAGFAEMRENAFVDLIRAKLPASFGLGVSTRAPAQQVVP